jgi:hypothetical protein
MPRAKRSYKRISKRLQKKKTKSKKRTRSKKISRSKSRFSVNEDIVISGKGNTSLNTIAIEAVEKTKNELTEREKKKDKAIKEFNNLKISITWSKIIYDAISEREYRLRFTKNSDNSLSAPITYKTKTYTTKAKSVFEHDKKERYNITSLKLTTQLVYNKDTENNDTSIMKILNEAWEQAMKIRNNVDTPFGAKVFVPRILKNEHYDKFTIGNMNIGETYHLECEKIGRIPEKFKIYIKKY